MPIQSSQLVFCSVVEGEYAISSPCEWRQATALTTFAGLKGLGLRGLTLKPYYVLGFGGLGLRGFRVVEGGLGFRVYNIIPPDNPSTHLLSPLDPPSRVGYTT